MLTTQLKLSLRNEYMNNKWQNNQSENLVVVVPQKGKSPSDAGFLIFKELSIKYRVVKKSIKTCWDGRLAVASWKNKAKMNRVKGKKITHGFHKVKSASASLLPLAKSAIFYKTTRSPISVNDRTAETKNHR